MSSQQLPAYPRRKNFIKNLNILLDTSPILSPEKSLAAKLLTKNFSEKLPSKSIEQHKKLLNSPIKIVQDRRLFSLRKLEEKNFAQIDKKYSSSRNTQSAHLIKSARNLCTKNLLDSGIYHQEVSPRRIINTQGSFRGKKSEININDQFQGNVSFVTSKSTQFFKNPEPRIPDRYQSVEIKKSSEGTLFDYRPKQQNKKEYLKKGSRIKTSILHNILKMKLLNQHQSQKSGGEYQIDSKQIFRLIKLYKGALLTENRQKKQLTPSLSRKQILKQRQKDPLYIQGWLNEAQSEEQNEGCC